MAFMNLYSDHFKAYLVETNNGTDIVPANLVNLPYNVGDEKFGSDGDLEVHEALLSLQDYCEGEPKSFQVVEGWFARYSAPGFLDATSWVGPCETEDEALKECRELYGNDEDGDE